MINKLISKSQVRVLNCENCPSEDYARGYARAISDVLDLATIPTLGYDTLEKIRAEIEELDVEDLTFYEGSNKLGHNEFICKDEVTAIIDKHIGGKDK